MGKVKLWSQQSLLAPVVDDKDLVNKEYVDNAVIGTIWGAVVAAATANLAGSMSGDGLTLTASANGALSSIDGVTVAIGDRVLLPEQSDKTQNGIFVVQALGDGSSPWVFVRAEDANAPGEFRPNKKVYVLPGGAKNGNRDFKQTTSATIVIGTTPIEFAPDVDTGKVISETLTFTGNGSLSEFTISHNFNTDKLLAVIRDADGTECVFATRFTTTTMVVSSDVVIPSGDVFTVVVHGQPEQ